MILHNKESIEDKIYKKNYVLLIADSVVFTNAMTFLSVNVVITYFLNAIGASALQISLAGSLVSICVFVSQPFFAKMAVERHYKIKTFTKLLYTQRFFFLLFTFTIPYFAKTNPHLTVILFLICWGIFNIFVGSYSPFYMSLLSKMIPNNKQGGLLGIAGTLGNIIALGASCVVGVLLNNLQFPYNYTIIFMIGTILLILEVINFELMKETPDAVTAGYMSQIGFIKDIPNILKKNIKVMKIIIGNSLIVISNSSLGYYVLYAIRNYHAKAEQIVLFNAITVCANVFGNVIFGILADKYSHKTILKIASAFGTASGLVILSGHSIFTVYIAFALIALCSSGYNISNSVIIIHNSPKEQVPIYISANTMITLLISSIFMITSGYIIDKISFIPIFAAISIAGFLGCAVFSLIKQ